MDDGVGDPELLRYISGEISFDAWLEKQDVQQQTQSTSEPSENYSESYFEGDSTIFSSWGSAFTSTTSGNEKWRDDQVYNEDVEDEEEEEQNFTSKGSIETPTMNTRSVMNETSSAPVKSSKAIFKMPSFAEVPAYNEKEAAVVQGCHIQPLTEKLHKVIQDATVRKVLFKETTSKKRQVEEIPDIVKDFQAFQLRKYKKRRKLPELLRNQMGQANLLVAKGDFKQAADICMTVIKEAPSSGQPFKTLSFIYEEQGDKEMSLQYSLISAFLDCKDSNEWLELAKRCSDAGNIKQTLACYDRACKFKPGDLELQWERSVIYFENMDYRKCLDIYQTIIKIIIPSDKDLYIAVARSIAKIYHDLSLVDKAGETIESAFSVCPGFQDVEGLCEDLFD